MYIYFYIYLKKTCLHHSDSVLGTSINFFLKKETKIKVLLSACQVRDVIELLGLSVSLMCLWRSSVPPAKTLGCWEDGTGSQDAHERVADSSDREREVCGTVLGGRGQDHVQDPVEARSQEGLQADGGCGSVQGLLHDPTLAFLCPTAMSYGQVQFRWQKYDISYSIDFYPLVCWFKVYSRIINSLIISLKVPCWATNLQNKAYDYIFYSQVEF